MNTEQLLREARKIADDIDANVLAVANRQMKPGAFPLELVCKAASLLRALSQPAEGGEVWGWAIEDKHGVAQAIRPARKEFFGCVQSTEPFTAEDIVKMDREWAGIAPHHVVTLYTTPPASQEQAAQCGMSEVDRADDDALRFACRVLESNAPEQDRKAALQMLYAIRIRVRKATNREQPAPAVQAVPDDVGDRLFRLLNGAAGDGLVINDVDAAELFCDMFPEHTAMLSASPAAKEGGE